MFGFVLEPDGSASAVPKSIAGNIGRMHGTARPEGGWHIVFAQVAKPFREDISGRIEALWYGVFDGSEWSELQRLPAPGGY